ncbi:MCE family protein [Ruegeria sediminis]|uniref:MCE family protein n=1 Tax=Ruegeria sediminis TaxID=2583820 RepID=A0ABY2WUG8_9RHOB|nr:MlaD family protein [Ruegeria sediminis]TMV05658.1 MCE family protein [Ruegeria sediminis]
METKANYILIGAFTLAGILGLFGFLLWLAKFEVTRQYDYYDVLFDNVSGLSTAGTVLFNGLPVGQVISLQLDDDDPSKVRVRLEVDADTPIKTDTIAELQSLGVTGVSTVALSGGSASAALLPSGGVIKSRRSALQSIFEGAPELLSKAITLMEDLQSIVDDKNRAAVSELLENLSSASGKLDRALTDFETLSDDLGKASQEISAFSGKLGQLSDTAEKTLTTAEETLSSAKQAADTAVGTLDTANQAFATAEGLMQNELTEFLKHGTDAARTLDTTVKTLEPTVVATIESAQTLIEQRLPQLADQVLETAQVLEEQINIVGADAAKLITRYDEVGKTAQARLDQTASAITAFEIATNDAKEAIATINAAVQQDLPGMMEDLRSAAQTANRVVGEVGTDVSEVSDRLKLLSDEGSVALAVATETFSNANETLTAITKAMDTAQDTLGVAEQTFSSVNKVVNEDVETIVSDVRGAVDALSTTAHRVADNFDTISAEIMSASKSASELVGTIDTIVQENRRPISEFLRFGLPQLERFVEESRRLVSNVDRLVDRVERDPARFLLGTQSSEFRQ